METWEFRVTESHGPYVPGKKHNGPWYLVRHRADGGIEVAPCLEIYDLWAFHEKFTGKNPPTAFIERWEVTARTACLRWAVANRPEWTVAETTPERVGEALWPLPGTVVMATKVPGKDQWQWLDDQWVEDLCYWEEEALGIRVYLWP